MNDHCHVVARPFEGVTLSTLNHTWKSFSAKLMQRAGLRHGQVWQHESYDWMIRNSMDLWRKIRYVRNNPIRRWPGVLEYPWVWPKLKEYGPNIM
jgi:hypothetical protein